MPGSDQRSYLKKRIEKEGAMAAGAACIEAALVHDALQQHYAYACAACDHGRTDACVDCERQALCAVIAE